MVGVSDERILPRRHEVAPLPILETVVAEGISLHISLMLEVSPERGQVIGVEGLIRHGRTGTRIQPLMRSDIPRFVSEIDVLRTHQTILCIQVLGRSLRRVAELGQEDIVPSRREIQAKGLSSLAFAQVIELEGYLLRRYGLVLATRLPVLTRIGADNRRDLVELHRGLRHEIGCLQMDAYSIEVAMVSPL